MIKVPKEKRGNKGRLGISTQCILYPDPKSSEEITTFDLGKGGMCIFSNKSLEVGHKVEVRCEAIWDSHAAKEPCSVNYHSNLHP